MVVGRPNLADLHIIESSVVTDFQMFYIRKNQDRIKKYMPSVQDQWYKIATSYGVKSIDFANNYLKLIDDLDKKPHPLNTTKNLYDVPCRQFSTFIDDD